MKRDMDLVRLILMAIEEETQGFSPSDLTFEGFTQEQVGYHIYIMGQAELLEVADATTLGSSGPEAIPKCLTWYGHEFLDAAREPTRWQKAKEMLEKAGGASIKIWMEVLTELVKQSVGL